MTQVAVIVKDALELLRVVDANEAPEAEDAAKAIRALNLMMRVWEVDGVAVGWMDVAAPGDELPAPPEAEEAITYNLALRLRPSFGAALEQDVVATAASSLASLTAQVLANTFERISYPDLPAGEAEPRGSWRDGFTR